MPACTQAAYRALLEEKGRIALRVGYHEASGLLYLYDEETGRVVDFQRNLQVSLVDPFDDLQLARIEIITDPRLK